VISNPFLGGKIPKKFGVTSNSYSLQKTCVLHTLNLGEW
jgi:hypothetical protein